MKYRPTWEIESVPEELILRRAAQINASRSSGRRGHVSCSCGECAVCAQREYRRKRRSQGKDLALRGDEVNLPGGTPVISPQIRPAAVRDLFMIGHSNHDWKTFAELLKKHEITRLIDVRSSARSRLPHFNQAFLSGTLEPGIYSHWPLLGGKNPQPAEVLRREMKRLLTSYGASRDARLALMCTEGDFRECHRHYLLAPIAREMGWRVVQINKDGSLVEDRGPGSLALGF
jgi:hypothetical protein